jgi:oligopeptide transport system substrate-binding protein
MEKIQHDVLTKLGLKLSLVNMDWKTHLKSLATDPAPVFRFGWMAPFNDPISHLQAFTSKDPNNYTGWKNAEYDALVRKIAQMSKGVEREKKIREAQTLLVEREAVVIPILHYVQTFAVSSRVKCFKVNQFAMLRFDEITENCR